MKKMLQLAAVCWLLVLLDFHVATAYAQGALAPPGAPAATMKTLDQIEPRTIVNSVNTPGDVNNLFSISQPGSYYLTSNLTGVSGKSGITIFASNVQLDLNGFTVQGAAGSSSGIYIPNAVTNVAVRNGSVNGWGGSGVLSGSSISVNEIFEHLNVSANSGHGFFLSAAAAVNDCNVQNNGNAGIYCVNSSVSGCTAYNNVYGIRVFNGTVANCIAIYNSNLGISVQYGTVSGCHAENNGIYGIYASPGMVTGCYSRLNNGSGIYVDAPGSEVVGNNCIANNPTNSASAAGIYINDARNRIEDNHLYNNGYAGIQVSSSLTYINNVIIKNSVIGTVGANYITPNAQIVGPLITTTGTITNSNPWANFSF